MFDRTDNGDVFSRTPQLPTFYGGLRMQKFIFHFARVLLEYAIGFPLHIYPPSYLPLDNTLVQEPAYMTLSSLTRVLILYSASIIFNA